MTETVWLLDVDGVINAGNPGWQQKPVEAGAMCGGRRYTMRWAPSLIDEIRAIANSGLVTVTWCTTWCDEARQLEKLWDLPELPVAFSNLPTRYTGDAKMHAACNVLKSGNRLVWTDDTEVPTWGYWLDEIRTLGESLLIQPDEDKGLLVEDIHLIRQFIGMGQS